MKMLIWYSLLFLPNTIWWRNRGFLKPVPEWASWLCQAFLQELAQFQAEGLHQVSEEVEWGKQGGNSHERRGGICRKEAGKATLKKHVLKKQSVSTWYQKLECVWKKTSSVCTVLIWFFWVYHLNRLVTVFPSVLRQGRTSQEVLPGDSCYLSHAGGAFCSNLHRWSPKHSENDDVWIVDVYGYDVSRTFIGNLWKAKGNYMKIPAATVQHKECEWFHVLPTQNWQVNKAISQKKAHIKEIQVNGGTTTEKASLSKVAIPLFVTSFQVVSPHIMIIMAWSEIPKSPDS